MTTCSSDNCGGGSGNTDSIYDWSVPFATATVGKAYCLTWAEDDNYMYVGGYM